MKDSENSNTLRVFIFKPHRERTLTKGKTYTKDNACKLILPQDYGSKFQYMTTGKTIALSTFVGRVMSLLFNMLSRLVINFHPRSKRLLISWLQCTRGPFYLYPFHVHYFFSVIAFLSGVRQYVTVVLICISIIISNVEHLFMFLLTLCGSLGKCLFRSSAHFLIGLFGVTLLQLLQRIFFLRKVKVS